MMDVPSLGSGRLAQMLNLYESVDTCITRKMKGEAYDLDDCVNTRNSLAAGICE